MCQAHGIPSVFYEDVWVALSRSPMFYPDAVTLMPGDVPVLDRIDTSPGCSVKDSFAMLDLPEFTTLFEAQWIARPASSAPTPYTFEWSIVASPAELAAFDEAFGGPDLFVPTLLQSPRVGIFAGWDGGQIVAGCVTNVSGRVVGLSNVFGPPGETSAVWGDVVGAVTARFPDMPIVGYERDLDLEAATGCGFESLGMLRVLVR
jgi:hypothetical protein